jgi:probable addiction module antidote protein
MLMNKKNKRSIDYHGELIAELKDHDEAVAYLNAALEESLIGDEESQEVLLNALRNVAEAQGGLGKLAKKTHVRREALYRVLSFEGNPELRTFTSLVRAMGLNLRFC